jgi:hypothetical protein
LGVLGWLWQSPGSMRVNVAATRLGDLWWVLDSFLGS